MVKNKKRLSLSPFWELPGLSERRMMLIAPKKFKKYAGYEE
jgi:hypothetical protein